MVLETSRFGNISISDSDILHFPEGMLGFGKIHEYILIESVEDSIFLWLQALKKPGIAFPLIEPEIFEKSYKVDLEEGDLKDLKLKKIKTVKVFAIVTIPTDPSKMTANLKAPIVINLKERLAKQVILLEADYPIRYPVFAELQQFSVSAQKPLFPPTTNIPAYQSIPINEDLGIHVR